MPAQKSLFIVGAGASREFGLPTGRDLLDDIARIAERIPNGNVGFRYDGRGISGADIGNSIYASLVDPRFPAQGADSDRLRLRREAALAISRVAPLSPSIDNFLDARQTDMDIPAVGKIMIAAVLLAAESKSSLYDYSGVNTLNLKEVIIRPKTKDREAEFGRAAQSWLGELFWLLAEGRQFTDFLAALRNISFICFNYDRCIEHFLINAACLYYGADTNTQVNRADTINHALRIVRPYGSLGGLKIKQDRAVGFGKLDDSLYESSKSIRTFTEPGLSNNLDDDIKKAFEGLPRVFFLGFGYLDLNLKKIFGDNSYTVGEVFGTAKGISSHSKDVIEGKLHKSLKGLFPERIKPVELPPERISLLDTTCQGLIQTYSHYLRDQTR